MAPSSSSSPHGPFKSYPQKYPRASVHASRAAQALKRLVQQAPHSQVAIVVDPSFHVSQGYVLCQIHSAIVRVYSVPYGSVVNGMRLYARQIGALKTNQSYIFDGYAPNLSGLGTNGSVLVTANPPTGTQVCSSGGATATNTVASLSSATGYYWHCFFYLPVLPPTVVTLFQFAQVGGSNMVMLEYLPSGYLQFRSQDNHGYITNTIVPPHNAHWVSVQPSNGTSAEFLVDGVENYSGLAGVGDDPTFTGGLAQSYPYALSYLSDTTGAGQAPLGSWISKMGFGMSYASGVVPLLATGVTIPAYDSDIPNLNTGTTQKTQNLYLCEDALGSTGLFNSGQQGAAGALTLSTAYSAVQISGPY